MKLIIGKYYVIRISGHQYWNIPKGDNKYLIAKCVSYNRCFEFIENVRGHDGNDLGRSGHCWYVNEENIVAEINEDDLDRLDDVLMAWLI